MLAPEEPHSDPSGVAVRVWGIWRCRDQRHLGWRVSKSNRTKGLKILRCFPHCCPEHIDRGYCGTSLSAPV
ncbi:hypothetical protein PRNP1_014565 [Phytophthora ramorum]